MNKKMILFYPEGLNRSTISSTILGRSIPYSLLYLERTIRHLDIDIIIIDGQFEKTYKNIIGGIKYDLLLVGVSVITEYQLAGAKDFSLYVRTISNCYIIWRVWHPALLPRQVLNESFINYLIIGQGKMPLKEFIERGLSYKAIDNIDSLCSKRAEKIFANSYTSFTSYDHIGEKINFSLINNYVYNHLYDGKMCINYISSHGCLYKCGFCCLAILANRKWYGKDINKIIKDFKHMKKIAKINSIYFVDDIFFTNRERALNICTCLINEKFNLKLNASAHASSFLKLYNDTDIELMYKSGGRQIYISAEFRDQEVLDKIGEKISVDDNIKFVQFLSRHNIILRFTIMLRFPMNHEKDINLTIEMIRNAKLINPQLKVVMIFFTPYPGTDLYELACKNGFIHLKTLEEWSCHIVSRYHAPWVKYEYRMLAEIFTIFYSPLLNPRYVALFKYRKIVCLLMLIYHRKIWKMFKENVFAEHNSAILFFKRFSLGYETFLEYTDYKKRQYLL